MFVVYQCVCCGCVCICVCTYVFASKYTMYCVCACTSHSGMLTPKPLPILSILLTHNKKWIGIKKIEHIIPTISTSEVKPCHFHPLTLEANDQMSETIVRW